MLPRLELGLKAMDCFACVPRCSHSCAEYEMGAPIREGQVWPSILANLLLLCIALALGLI